MHQLIDRKNNITIYLIFLILLSTTVNKNIKNQNINSILINKIDVKGLSNNKDLQIINELNEIFYKNIFLIKKEEIDSVMSKYAIIEKYKVKKIYPKKLNIEINQTNFIAKISGEDQLLVGSNGKIIANERSDKTLPYIFGKYNSEEFLKFKKNVDRSKFNFNDFKSISFYPSKRWDIVTTSGILIKLPEKNYLDSLNLAAKVIQSDKFKKNNIIDLRILNHLVLQ